MIFQYLKKWQEDFWFQIFFLVKYFIEVIAKRIADSPHLKSFSQQFRRGEAEFQFYAKKSPKNTPFWAV
jgi:hypothetical protein